MPTLFLAPTAKEARRAAWDFLRQSRTSSASSLSNHADLFDLPLIFTESRNHGKWRDLARQNAKQTVVVPRLVRAEAYFARAYASLARRRPLSGADRLWVLQGAARRAQRQNPSLETELARIVGGREALKTAARHIASLRRVAWPQFPSAPGSEVLNALLRAYDARLEALEAFDFEAAPAFFADVARGNRAFNWPHALLVDDLPTVSPAMQAGLDALLKKAETVAATLVCSGDEIGEALAGALEFWQSRGAKIVRVGDFKSDGARVAARILGSETPVEAPTPLFLTPAHTPREELERIAAHIRLEVEAGATPADFLLGCADFGVYEADARTVFAEFGVPLDWPLATSLRNAPLVRALLCALDIGAQKINVHALHDLFGDGTLRLQSDEKTFDARRLRAAGLAARHPELDDLVATQAAFERKCAQLTKNARHDDAPNRFCIEAALLAGDLELVGSFTALCAPLQEPCTAGVWRARVLEVIEKLAGHWMESDSLAGVRAQEDLIRFQTAVENVATRARGWDDPENETSRGPVEWRSWLEMELESGAAVEESPVSGGVQVSGIDSACGARATFWCGLSERAWPRPAAGYGATRELEALLGAHLASPLARATYLLARGAAENRALYLSHALYIGGKETPASPLLDDLRVAFPNANWHQLAPVSETNSATRRGVLRSWNRCMSSENVVWAHSELPPETRQRLQNLSQMRAQRRDRELGAFDGVLGTRGHTLMEERDRKGGARLSGSDLEFYARCPLRYFFERVLRLRHAQRLDDDIDPRAAGTLVHEVARLYLPASAPLIKSGDFSGGLQLLGEITRQECEKLPLRPILREAEWRRLMGFDGQSGPLVKWLRLEIEQGSGAWGVEMRPFSHSDVRIDGISSGLEHRFEIEVGGHKIKGFIDRIDVSADGNYLAVIDYKSGDIAGLPSWKSGDNGLHFQLAIYALAVRNLSFNGAPPRLAMAYLSLKRAKLARGIGQEGTLGRGCIGAKNLSDEAFEAWLGDVSARAARIGDLRAAGVFNISLQSSKDAKCDSCTSRSLCGQHGPTQASRFETHRGSPFLYLPILREWET